jgi:ABC-type microcin C transport system permease subunit YejB
MLAYIVRRLLLIIPSLSVDQLHHHPGCPGGPVETG